MVGGEMEEINNKETKFTELRKLAERLLHREPERTQEKSPDNIQKIVHELQVHQMEL
jgi:hypothetical protein